MSRSVGQALADDTYQRPLRARFIIVSETDAMVVAEIIFRKVAVQMLLAATNARLLASRYTGQPIQKTP
jgi:hypothetical protein